MLEPLEKSPLGRRLALWFDGAAGQCRRARRSRQGARMLKLQGIVGHVNDAAIAAKLHELRHHGGIEYLVLAPADVKRKRLRVTTDAGTDCAIVAPGAGSADFGRS